VITGWPISPSIRHCLPRSRVPLSHNHTIIMTFV